MNKVYKMPKAQRYEPLRLCVYAVVIFSYGYAFIFAVDYSSPIHSPTVATIPLL